MESSIKSPRQKSMEELHADIDAMRNYKDEQQDTLARGKAAEAEIAKRLGENLNTKAGYDLLVEKRALDLVNRAAKQQFDPHQDVILVAVVVDNHHAKQEAQRLNETRTLEIIKANLDQHLPEGTLASAISLQKMQKDNLRPFSDSLARLSAAISLQNKVEAARIQKEYKHPFSFNPTKYLPEDI